MFAIELDTYVSVIELVIFNYHYIKMYKLEYVNYACRYIYITSITIAVL